MKLCAIIFSWVIFFNSTAAHGVHSFGVITDIEFQYLQSEEQKNKNAFLGFFTFEQNWSNDSSKFIGQIRIFEYVRQESPNDLIIHELYPADFNFQTNFKSQRITIGYQSIFLTEGFNLIDSEVFHSKNNQVSVFKSPEKRFYTAPGVDYKIFGDKLTLQLAVLKSERVERLSLSQKAWILKTVPNFIEDDYRKNSNDLDQLLKLLGTSAAVDWSVYYARTFEKLPMIQINVLKNRFENISLPFSSIGLGFSGLLGSSVFRFDFQKNSARTYIDTNNVAVSRDQNNVNFSWERAFGDNFIGNVILGSSQMNHGSEIPLRESTINDLFLNINYKINNRSGFEFSRFERLSSETVGHRIAIVTKILNNIEVNYGAEVYWTGAKSKLKFLDSEDRLYLAVKATAF